MLEEADFGLTDRAMQGNTNRFAGDQNLMVKFFYHPRINKAKSQEAGRPIYEEVPYIQINAPGNKESEIIRPATDLDKRRFPVHFEKFMARQNQDEATEGTILEEWPQITRSQVEELKFLNIRTVEQLASVSDSNAQNVMGINMLRQKAKTWLEKNNDTDAKLKEAQNTIDALTARLDALEADKPARRGRPKKTEES